MKLVRHLKPPFKHNIEQEGQTFGEEKKQTKRLILLIRGTGRAGGLHLPYVVVQRNVSCFSFESEQTNHGRRNAESSVQKTVKGW